MIDRGIAIAARRILIVDDHPDSADAACLLLTKLGHVCRPATTGEAALSEAVEFAPDVVLCDIGLPDISGYEVARVLRDRLGDTIYLAAVTGWDQASDRARAYAAGFDEHVVKPATGKILQSIIKASWRGRHGLGRGTGPVPIVVARSSS